MSLECALSIIEPDAIGNKAIRDIHTRFQRAGLLVVARRV